MKKIFLFLFFLISIVVLFKIIKIEDSGKVENQLSSEKKEEIMPTSSLIPEIKTGKLTEGKKNVLVKTPKGEILFELYPQAAPNTVVNFLKKIQDKSYENLTFHRVEDWVVQGGDPLGNGTGGGDQKTELNDLTFSIGSIGIARAGDINVSNDSQFFIVKKESGFLDRQYTNFGKVIKGLDVVEKIEIGDKIISLELL